MKDKLRKLFAVLSTIGIAIFSIALLIYVICLAKDVFDTNFWYYTFAWVIQLIVSIFGIGFCFLILFAFFKKGSFIHILFGNAIFIVLTISLNFVMGLVYLIGVNKYLTSTDIAGEIVNIVLILLASGLFIIALIPFKGNIKEKIDNSISMSVFRKASIIVGLAFIFIGNMCGSANFASSVAYRYIFLLTIGCFITFVILLPDLENLVNEFDVAGGVFFFDFFKVFKKEEKKKEIDNKDSKDSID